MLLRQQNNRNDSLAGFRCSVLRSPSPTPLLAARDGGLDTKKSRNSAQGYSTGYHNNFFTRLFVRACNDRATTTDNNTRRWASRRGDRHDTRSNPLRLSIFSWRCDGRNVDTFYFIEWWGWGTNWRGRIGWFGNVKRIMTRRFPVTTNRLTRSIGKSF